MVVSHSHPKENVPRESLLKGKKIELHKEEE
jgi:hypothetical protein